MERGQAALASALRAVFLGPAMSLSTGRFYVLEHVAHQLQAHEMGCPASSGVACGLRAGSSHQRLANSCSPVAAPAWDLRAVSAPASRARAAIQHLRQHAGRALQVVVAPVIRGSPGSCSTSATHSPCGRWLRWVMKARGASALQGDQPGLRACICSMAARVPMCRGIIVPRAAGAAHLVPGGERDHAERRPRTAFAHYVQVAHLEHAQRQHATETARCRAETATVKPVSAAGMAGCSGGTAIIPCCAVPGAVPCPWRASFAAFHAVPDPFFFSKSPAAC